MSMSSPRQGDAVRRVLAFVVRSWHRRWPLVAGLTGAITLATLAEVLLPLYAGRLVDALSGSERRAALEAAWPALLAMTGLGLATAVPLSLHTMSDIVRNGFGRVQRFSPEWHANTFSGSTVRKISRGMWAIDGQDVASASQASLRAQVAIVTQEPVLFHRSVAENIAYARPGASAQEIERAAHLANTHAFIGRLPKGYATLVGERGVKLSGGERQRVALARAFLADAPILILDEATSSLDSLSEALVQEAMIRLMRGRTAIVIAHRLSTVRALDRILVFDRGRIVEDGPHATLMRRPNGAYRALFERQSVLAEGV
ncbi:ATP-binding cassette domain-containing protein [Methylobacterium fujisawaense]|uniref:ATP-binding cassette domain-containing protein n=1 Tax=Methylobacterium fujisawaense TaxID=107400 RepID=UPI0031F4E00C